MTNDFKKKMEEKLKAIMAERAITLPNPAALEHNGKVFDLLLHSAYVMFREKEIKIIAHAEGCEDLVFIVDKKL